MLRADGTVTTPWVTNGTHALGFGGEPTHGWNGNTESCVQMAKVTLAEVGEDAQ